MDVKDSNGNILNEGDSVTLTKDLKVKGSSITLKRGKVIKNIRLTNRLIILSGSIVLDLYLEYAPIAGLGYIFYIYR